MAAVFPGSRSGVPVTRAATETRAVLQGFRLVGDTGFEPVTPAVSRHFRPNQRVSGSPLHTNAYRLETLTALDVAAFLCVLLGAGYCYWVTQGWCQIRVRFMVPDRGLWN